MFILVVVFGEAATNVGGYDESEENYGNVALSEKTYASHPNKTSRAA